MAALSACVRRPKFIRAPAALRARAQVRVIHLETVADPVESAKVRLRVEPWSMTNVQTLE